jgi:hypothetical protein
MYVILFSHAAKNVTLVRTLIGLPRFLTQFWECDGDGG